MMKRFLNICFLVLLSCGVAQAQENILNADKPDKIGKKTKAQKKNDHDDPLPYGHVGERDILWSKNHWEYIDLDERVNLPLLYPTDSGRLGNSRKSLYQVLVKGLKSGEIAHAYSNSYFTREISMDELGPTMQYRDTLSQGIAQLNRGEELDPQYVTKTNVNPSDVQGYRIRGMWYFDKKQGALKYRLLGIAPMVIDAYQKNQNAADPTPVELFWVFYPEARDLLYHETAFNTKNSSQPISFDHILNSRRFHAVIYKEDNVHGDREVEDYKKDNSLMQLLESRRLKEKVRDFESNMWNY